MRHHDDTAADLLHVVHGTRIYFDFCLEVHPASCMDWCAAEQATDYCRRLKGEQRGLLLGDWRDAPWAGCMAVVAVCPLPYQGTLSTELSKHVCQWPEGWFGHRSIGAAATRTPQCMALHAPSCCTAATVIVAAAAVTGQKGPVSFDS